MKLIKGLLLCFACWSLHFSLSAQYGLILEDDTAYKSTPMIPNFSGGGKYTKMPLFVNLKKYTPYPQSQGETGACVGWATGYGALTTAIAASRRITDRQKITDNAFSAMFIYNQIKVGDCKAGAKISDALEFLLKHGDCRSRIFDDSTTSCSKVPSDEDKTNARKFKIKDYYTLFKLDDSPKVKKFKIKKSLSEGNPIVVGMNILKNFITLNKEDKYWKPSAGDATNAGGHAMVVVGYNDGRQAFEVMNSWGKNWGNEGFMWIKYKDFIKYCKYAYQLNVDENLPLVLTEKRNSNAGAGGGNGGSGGSSHVEPVQPPTNDTDLPTAQKTVVTLHGDFVFRYPTDMIDDQIVFSEAEIVLENNTYLTKRTDWEVGQVFQLVARNIRKNRYVYVFSIDGKNNTNIHWPPAEQGISAVDDNIAEQLRADVDAYKQGPLVPYTNAQIVMPSAESGLVKEVEGTDYLIILYAYDKISDFQTVVKKVKQAQGACMNRLQQALGERLIPSSDITYNSSKMSYTAKSTKGTIVPIVLKAEGYN